MSQLLRLGAVALILLFAVQSEIRFGARARTSFAGASDRRSTLALSLASMAPMLGFALVTLAQAGGHLHRHPIRLPGWALWPGPTPAVQALAWVGVSLGALGLLLRLWAVLTLRTRYTRTLLVQEGQRIERGGPYRFVRHPGYLGSLLCLNAIGLASCNGIVFAVSLVATLTAYAYRIHVEDQMLVAAFGEEYERYRRQFGALFPFPRSSAN